MSFQGYRVHAALNKNNINQWSGSENVQTKIFNLDRKRSYLGSKTMTVIRFDTRNEDDRRRMSRIVTKCVTTETSECSNMSAAKVGVVKSVINRNRRIGRGTAEFNHGKKNRHRQKNAKKGEKKIAYLTDIPA
jgi:hypothetical protein